MGLGLDQMCLHKHRPSGSTLKSIRSDGWSDGRMVGWSDGRISVIIVPLRGPVGFGWGWPTGTGPSVAI